VKIPRIINLIAGLALGASIMTPVQAAIHTERHTFSIGDVQGDFEGRTFGGTTTSDGTIPADTTILCDAPGSSVFCTDIMPMVDRKLYGQQNPITLYPIDSAFGYYIIDFLGAAQKERDDDYAEGFIGDVPSAYFPIEANIDGNIIPFNEDPVTGKYPPITGGVAISNAATETYKVKPPIGTWCRGLGGLSVKCETEHYSVMEHILSCHEVIPYFNFDFDNNRQAVLNEGSAEIPALPQYDCADAGLDDIALLVIDGMIGGLTGTEQLVNGTPCEDIDDPEGCQMFPNDKTDVNNNLALTDDYSVQLKDDGKALYGWGTIHKRPNDVRMYASLPLPAEWKAPGANYIINKAKLVIRHHVTNNPNDQIRPEDLENEAATGRKPSYQIEGTIGGPDEVWKSTKACYEGDSDLIDTEDGNVDPTFFGIGTIFKNTPYAVSLVNGVPVSIVPTNDSDLPYPLSSDLSGAFTNAWYTTVDRAPFEWSYDPDGDPDNALQNFVGSWLENPALGALVSGPRWRLRPNKYGQDLPGLEVSLVPLPGEGTNGADCYAPPFTSDLIKYPVGEPTITEINLLDWDEDEGPSPLATSVGWVDIAQNGSIEQAGTNNGVPYTTNGLPMSDDFDLAVYVKGDRKPTAVYDAYLVIDWDAEGVLVEAPDVVGLTTAAAEAAIVAANLTVGTITVVYNPVVPAGIVIRQDPVDGTLVQSGSAVDFVVSRGPLLLVEVPDVTGLSQAAAEAAIVAANLTVGNISLVNNPVVPAGDVIRQDPKDGTVVASGSAVDIVVSKGPLLLVEVPDVTGLSQAAAEAAIVAANLTVGTIEMRYNPVVPAGNVIRQDPEDGTLLPSGSAVDIVVSLGPLGG
jgi:beta-lactam-binding protein with PASTA domain